MFKKSNKGYYFWEEFAEIDGIVHGFSTRKFGDMNWKHPNHKHFLKSFCDALGVNYNKTIGMKQVHGNNASWVLPHKRGSTIDTTDALCASEKGIFLVGRFADCVPVLFADRKKEVFGVAHAGWKGAYKEIVKVLISKMIDYGSSAQNVLVGIGPSIRACCYNIGEDRAQLFAKKFPKWQQEILQKKGNLTFLDLQKIIKLQLDESGISKINIKDCTVCTKDNMSDFYSYRGERDRNSFGHFVGVIGRV